MHRLLLILLVAAVAAAGGAALYLWHEPPVERRPDFTLNDLDGRARAIAEWDGKVVLLNFWAPWCKPCREEMPMLVALQRDYGPRGLQVLGLAIDDPEPVHQFAGEFKINYPLFADLLKIIPLQDSLGDSRLPYSVLVDRQGRIVYRKAGALSRAEIEAELQPLL